MTREQLKGILEEFATEVDMWSVAMENHEIDMDRWSDEVEGRIEEILKANFENTSGAVGA